MAPAAAARQPLITGELSASGSTVIALAANGQAKAALVKRGRFKVRPRSSRTPSPRRRATRSTARSTSPGASPHAVRPSARMPESPWSSMRSSLRSRISRSTSPRPATPSTTSRRRG